MNITDEQKLKIWKEVMDVLNADAPRPDELSVKEYARLRGITQNQARGQLERLVKLELVEMRKINGVGGAVCYYRPKHSTD